MFGSLARKLRAFGLDTAYHREGGDEGIMFTARREGRIILTADRALHARAEAAGVPSFILTGRTDRGRILSLLASAKVSGVRVIRGGRLCSLCGARLVTSERRLVERLVPAPVARRHRLFYVCVSCGKVYWRGSHWKKLSALERAFGKRSSGRR